MNDVRICPKCGSKQIKVIDSGRENSLYSTMVRKRKCTACNHTYETVEITIRDFSHTDTSRELDEEEKMKRIGEGLEEMKDRMRKLSREVRGVGYDK